MRNNILTYKGYITKIEYSVEDHVLHGKVEGINDLVTFESPSVAKIEKEFHSAVDDYLAFCEKVGKSPDKTYSGSFNVRINQNLHRLLALKAYQEGCTLNKAVEHAIENYVQKEHVCM